MNLNAPCYDSVLAIDAQLAKLQAEVTQMDSEFGPGSNFKPTSVTVNATNKQASSQS